MTVTKLYEFHFLCTTVSAASAASADSSSGFTVTLSPFDSSSGPLLAPTGYLDTIDTLRSKGIKKGAIPPCKAAVDATITLSQTRFGSTNLTMSAAMSVQATATTTTSSNRVISANPSRAGKTSSLSSGIAFIPDAKRGAHVLAFLTSLVPHLHQLYCKYDEIDDAQREFFLATISKTDTLPPLSPEESRLIDQSLSAHEDHNQSFKRIPNTVLSTVNFFQKIQSSGQTSTPASPPTNPSTNPSTNPPSSSGTVHGNSACGKAVATIDASASRVFAWLLCFATYERERAHIADQGPGVFRHIAEVPDSRSVLVAQVASVGSGMADRVISSWFTWRLEPDSSYIIAFAPTTACPATRPGPGEDPLSVCVAAVDTLITLDKRGARAVLAQVSGFWRVAPHTANTCEATYVVRGEFGGSIPRLLINMAVKSTLSTMPWIQGRFERNATKVDLEIQAEFPPPPPLSLLSDEQQHVVSTARALAADIATLPWIDIPTTIACVSMWYRHKPAKKGERTVAEGKCRGVVDCSTEYALAYWFQYCSRESLRISSEEGNPARLVVAKRSAHDWTVASIKKLPFPLRNREFVMRQLAARDDTSADTDCFIYVVAPADDVVDYGACHNIVRGVAHTVITFTPIGPNQCQLDFWQMIKPGGRIPAYVVDAVLPQALSPVADLKVRYDRSEEIDEEARHALACKIRDTAQTYTDQDRALTKRVDERLDAVSEDTWRALESPDYRVKMLVGWSDVRADRYSGGVIKAVTVVDATPEHAAVQDHYKQSRRHMRLMFDLNARMLRADSPCGENGDSHTYVLHQVRRAERCGELSEAAS